MRSLSRWGNSPLFLMVCSATLFGSAYPASKIGLSHLSPLELLFWTRVVAGASIIRPRRGTKAGPVPPVTRLWVLAIGTLLFLTVAIQLTGLELTTASNAGIIASIHIVATPLVARAFTGERVSGRLIVGAILVVGGIAIAAGAPEASSRGDLLVLCGALLLPFHTILISRVAPLVSTSGIVGWQSLIAGSLAFVALGGRLRTAEAVEVLIPIALVGLFAGSFATALQARAQRALSSSRAALVLGLEPVVGVLVAAAVIGERLGPATILGGGLVVYGLFYGLRETAT